MSKTVAVVFGLFGGPRIGGSLFAALKAADYTVVTSPAEADIVIAHSAGCFWLPPARAGQACLLVGPPYWPGKPMAQRFLGRARSNLQPTRAGYTPGSWLRRNGWGLYYAVTDTRRNMRILRYGSQFDLCSAVQGRRVIIVRNQDDSWITPNLDHIAAQHSTVRVIHLPGDHSDIAHHPEHYVALLKDL